ncbi:MAG: CDP-diacylglycerol--glycerol-3-phosphate 3-phosphatidyltransferase [Firmicutes bacterium]|jgi:CDP-diacylglycerol--glycerol-3-phosphate 3-phosphatidyltransferase|nr:CDP-diacylglycerol--glycerol-3-phosphate 3-phosphatidyltransferase [Bacillota bacterium]
MNLPNFLTLLRIFLVPVFTFLLLQELPHGNYLAAIVFIVASITDGLDGYLARSRKEVTRFGKLIDPIADKLLISAALLSLVQLGAISAWIALIIIGREFAVSGLRLLAASEGVVISASKWGKLKTVTQIIAVVALLIEAPGANILIWAAVLITIFSGVDYFLKAQDILKSSME